MELGWDVLPHPPYSPDLTPPDYYLFQPPQNFLKKLLFKSEDDVKAHLDQLLTSRTAEF